MTVHGFRTGALLLILGVLLPRLILFADYRRNDPLASWPAIDAAIHDAQGRAVAAGRIVPDVPFDRSPLYRYVVGGVYVLAGARPLAVSLVQVAIGCAALVLLHRLARRRLPGPYAALAVLLAAWHGPLAFFELKLLPAALAVALTVATVLLLERGRDGGRGTNLAAGAVAGLVVLARPNLLLLPLFAAVWLGFGRRAPALAACFLVGTAAVLAPVWAVNAAAGAPDVPIATGAGINLYLGHRRGAEVSFTGGFAGAEDASRLQEVAARQLARETGQAGRSAGAIDRAWIARAAAEVRADPIGWLGLELRKLRALVSEFEYGVNASYAAERDLLGSLRGFLVPFALLFGLGLAGLVTGGAPRGPLAVVLLAIVGSTLLFFTYTRFRLPAVPVLALLGAHGVARFVEHARSGRIGRALGLAGVAVAGAGMALLPPAPEARTQVALGHALVGAAAYRAGDLAGARAAYARALAVDAAAVAAAQSLGDLELAAGDPARAWDLHRRALAAAPGRADVLARAAAFRIQAPAPHGDAAGAERLAEAAVAADPALPLAHAVLGMARHLLGRPGAADAFRRAVDLAGGDPGLTAMITGFLRARQDPDAARILDEAAARRRGVR